MNTKSNHFKFIILSILVVIGMIMSSISYIGYNKAQKEKYFVSVQTQNFKFCLKEGNPLNECNNVFLTGEELIEMELKKQEALLDLEKIEIKKLCISTDNKSPQCTNLDVDYAGLQKCRKILYSNERDFCNEKYLK